MVKVGPPLHEATFRGCTESAEKLIEMGADIEHLDNAGEGPLLKACRFKREGCIRLLVGHNAKGNVLAGNLDTILHLVIRPNGYRSFADIHSPESTYNLVRFIIDYAGTNVHLYNADGKSPADLANGNEKLIALLNAADGRICLQCITSRTIRKSAAILS